MPGLLRWVVGGLRRPFVTIVDHGEPLYYAARLKNCLLAEEGVGSFRIWTTDLLMMVRLRCDCTGKEIWAGETCCREHLGAGSSLTDFPRLSLHLEPRAKKIDVFGGLAVGRGVPPAESG